MCLERRCRVERAIARRLAGTGKARIRGGNDCVHTQQRRISVAKQGDIGDGERALGLAMVALREADEAALLRLAVVSPVVKAHLQRDFHRRRAVRTVKAVAKSAGRDLGEPLG